MTWRQYREARGFQGIWNPSAHFAVPHTVGMLEKEPLSNAFNEGKLEKLIAQARELEAPIQSATN